MSTKRQQQYSALGIGLLFVGVCVLGRFIAPEIPEAQYSEDSTTVSAADHRIHYVKNPTEIDADGLVVQVYSSYTNGTSERAEDVYSAAEWHAIAEARGVHESMHTYYGDMESYDGKHRISVVPQRPFMPLLKGIHILVQRENEEPYVLPLDARELEWFPDNRRVAFALDGEIYVLDTVKRTYAHIAEGVGDIAIQ